MAKKKGMNMNPWMLSTIALVVLVIGFLAGNLFNGSISFGGPAVPKMDIALGERSGGTNGGDAYGDPNAPVLIQEFSDFQCPYCQKFFANTLPAIESTYVKTGKVRMMYKDFPLSFHANAKPSAIAARCAGAQDNFWGMHDALFLNHDKWADVGDPTPIFTAMAKALKLNTKKFSACLTSGQFDSLITADQAEGSRAAITGTPGFIINGETIVGAMPFNTFQKLIESKLSPESGADQ